MAGRFKVGYAFPGDIKLRMGHLNVNGLESEVDTVEDILEECKLDFLSLNETKLHGEEEVDIGGYRLIRNDRNGNTSGRAGGGVALVIRDGISHRKLPVSSDEVESLWIKLPGGKTDYKDDALVIGTMYRPPSADKDYMQEMMDDISTKSSKGKKPFILMGDLNIDFTDHSDSLVRNFKKYLKDEFGAKQIVKKPTFYYENYGSSLLDVVITNIPDSCHNNRVRTVFPENKLYHELVLTTVTYSG